MNTVRQLRQQVWSDENTNVILAECIEKVITRCSVFTDTERDAFGTDLLSTLMEARDRLIRADKLISHISFKEKTTSPESVGRPYSFAFMLWHDVALIYKGVTKQIRYAVYTVDNEMHPANAEDGLTVLQDVRDVMIAVKKVGVRSLQRIDDVVGPVYGENTLAKKEAIQSLRGMASAAVDAENNISCVLQCKTT